MFNVSAPDELSPAELSLLERHRDTEGPSDDAEDRMLAAIMSEVESEVESGPAGVESDDEADAPPAHQQAAEAAVASPWTAVAVGVCAFAAGVLLTCGLQGERMWPAGGEVAPSVSPMLADDDGASGVIEHNAALPKCEPVVVERQVFVPAGQAAAAQTPASGAEPRSTQTHHEPDGGPDMRPDPPTANPSATPAASTPSGEPLIAASTWGGPVRSTRGTGVGAPSSGRTQSRRSSAWGPTGSGSRAHGGSNGGSGVQPSGPNSKPGPGSSTPPSSSPGNPKPGAPNGPPSPQPDNPEQPRDPSDPQDPPQPEPNSDPEPDTDADGDEPPTGDEPPMDELEQCENELLYCHEDALWVCEEDPFLCMDFIENCDVEFDACLYGDYPSSEGDACEEHFGMCLEEAEFTCGFEEPEVCDEHFMWCEEDFMWCQDPWNPPPPPSWPGEQEGDTDF